MNYGIFCIISKYEIYFSRLVFGQMVKDDPPPLQKKKKKKKKRRKVMKDNISCNIRCDITLHRKIKDILLENKVLL